MHIGRIEQMLTLLRISVPHVSLIPDPFYLLPFSAMVRYGSWLSSTPHLHVDSRVDDLSLAGFSPPRTASCVHR